MSIEGNQSQVLSRTIFEWLVCSGQELRHHLPERRTEN